MREEGGMMLWKDRAYPLSDELRLFEHLNKKITYLLSLIIFIFLFGALIYADEFDFWEDALSYIGNIYPVGGNSNLLSFLVLFFGMILCSFLSFKISQDMKGYRENYYFKASGIGFMLLAVPSDLINVIHTIGGAVAVGSLWLFTVITLNNLFSKISKIRVLLYHLILQGTVLPYAFLYFSGSPVRQAAQKFAIAGLIIILKLSIKETYDFLQKKHAVS